MKKILLSLGAGLILTSVHAQNSGDLDATFGIGGYALTDPYANTAELYWDMITLSDDKIIKVGYTDDGNDTDILVAKFLADGTPDSTFAVNGFAQIDMSLGGDEDARGVVELPSGQLLVTGYVQTVGSLDGYVLRMNSDGTVDFTFGTSPGHTKFNTGDNLIAYGRAVISNGSDIYVGGAALVGGQSDIIIVKFTMGGGLSAAFASGGYAIKDIAGGNDHLQSMDLKANGAFVFGGTADSSGVTLGYVSSLSQFGTPVSFGNNGSYTFDMGSGINEVNNLYVDDNDNTVATGDEGVFPNVNGFVLRLTPAGILDNTFGAAGVAISDPGATTALFFRGVMETPNGDILAVGSFAGASHEIYAMILGADGSPNGNFNGSSDVIIPFALVANSVSTMAGALQSDGSIVVAGYLTSQDFVGENMFMIRLYPHIDDASIGELTKESIKAYPNPSTGQFVISNDNVEQVQLISMQGILVQSWNAQGEYNVADTVVPGVYIVRVKTENGVGTTRLIVE